MTLKISDLFQHPTRGLVLGAAGPELDTLTREDMDALLRTARTIEVLTIDGRHIRFSPSFCEISTSLDGKRGILVGCDIALSPQDIRGGQLHIDTFPPG